MKSLPARVFENTIIAYLSDLGQHPLVIEKCAELARQNRGNGKIKKLEKQESEMNKKIESISQEMKKLSRVIRKSKQVAPEFHEEVNKLSEEKKQLITKRDKISVDLSMAASGQIETETIRQRLRHFSEVVGHLSMEEKKELLQLLIKEIVVSPVNPQKGKAPSEDGAFDCKIRTSWFRVETKLFAIPSLPVSYDEEAKKFVFSNNWLALQDTFRYRKISIQLDVIQLKMVCEKLDLAG